MTFTWYGFHDIDSPGFAAPWLLSQGFDVIAFKCTDDSWFQRLDPQVFEDVARATRGYDDVVLFGSSMGGFAAIAFAGVLGASRVVALSPQYDITQGYDTRWAAEAARVDWRYRIAPGTAAQVPTHILYDDRMPEERAQVDRILAVLPTETTFLLAIPYAGHPVTSYLLQSQELGPLSLRLFAADHAVEWPILWSAQRKSALFFQRLAYHATEAERPRLAELAYRRAVALDPERLALRHQLAALLLRQDRADEALDHARAAAAIAPDSLVQLTLLARVLIKSGVEDEAEEVLDRALRHAPQDAALLRLKDGVVKRRARQAARRDRQAAVRDD